MAPYAAASDARGTSGAAPDLLPGEGVAERLGVVKQIRALREDGHRVLNMLDLVEEARVLAHEAQDGLT